MEGTIYCIMCVKVIKAAVEIEKFSQVMPLEIVVFNVI